MSLVGVAENLIGCECAGEEIFVDFDVCSADISKITCLMACPTNTVGAFFSHFEVEFSFFEQRIGTIACTMLCHSARDSWDISRWSSQSGISPSNADDRGARPKSWESEKSAESYVALTICLLPVSRDLLGWLLPRKSSGLLALTQEIIW